MQTIVELDTDGWVEKTRKNHCNTKLIVTDLTLVEPCYYDENGQPLPYPEYRHGAPIKNRRVVQCQVCSKVFSQLI